MKLEQTRASLERNLRTHLLGLKKESSLFHEALEYSVLPAGKLFRPLLACAVFADHCGLATLEKELSNSRSALAKCASALEIHHAYTLVHDDLPCMDDDDMRRGRPSTHKAYGQWQAVLAGDALLHHSHALVGSIAHEADYKMRQFFSWALGAKGLILGQVLDLNGSIHQNFSNLVRTHQLKTGRLIQTSLYLGSACANSSLDLKETKSIMGFGEALGVSFQLLDDLSEGTEELSKHEKSVNPFINFPEESLRTLAKTLGHIKNNLDEQKNANLKLVLEGYFNKMKSIIEKDLNSPNSLIFEHFDVIEENQKDDYHQIVELLIS